MAIISRTETSLSLATITLLLLIVFDTINLSGASSSSCNGPFGGCLVADEAPDFEFFTDSHNSRMLLDPSQAFGAGTGYRNQAAVNCERYKPYMSCLPNPKSPKVPENCGGTYNRGCRQLNK